MSDRSSEKHRAAAPLCNLYYYYTPSPAGSSDLEEDSVAAIVITSYNSTYDLDGALPNAFINMTCVAASGSYDRVAPFMDAFLEGLRIDSVLLAMWALLALVRALRARSTRSRASATLPSEFCLGQFHIRMNWSNHDAITPPNG